MKKIKLLLVTVSIMLMLCACNNPQEAVTSVTKQMKNVPTELVIIAADLSNAPKIDFRVKEIVDIIEKTCYANGHITIISPEGKPKAIFDKDIGDESYKSLSNTKQKQIAQAYASQIEDIFYSYIPTDTERNLLGGIDRASDIFKYSSYSQKILLIIDNGIQTTGMLDMTNISLHEGIESEICTQLSVNHGIPDLNQVKVFVSGFGATYLPQEDLSNTQKDTLNSLWETVIVSGGGSFNMLRSAYTDEGVENAPYVTPIGIRHDEAICIEDDYCDEPKTIPEGGLTLDESKIAFCPDSSHFLDPDKAKDELKKVADILIHESISVYIFGTTASTDDEAYSISLSKERAEAVKTELLNLGVDHSQIIDAEGLGYDNCFCVEDKDDNGIQIPDKAQLNRAVHILDSKDPLVETITHY